MTFSTSEKVYLFVWLGNHLPEFCHLSSQMCVCAPQHCAAFVSMLIRLNGTICWFLSAFISAGLDHSSLICIWMAAGAICFSQNKSWKVAGCAVLLPPSGLRCTSIITGSAVSCYTQWTFCFSAWQNKQIVHFIVTHFMPIFYPHFGPFLSWQFEKCH